MDKIYGLKWSHFGTDSSTSEYNEGTFVYYYGVQEIEKNLVDIFKGDRGHGISGHTVKDETKHEKYSIDENDHLINEKCEILGKVEWNIPSWFKKALIEAGIPREVSVPAYGGRNYHKIY